MRADPDPIRSPGSLSPRPLSPGPLSPGRRPQQGRPRGPRRLGHPIAGPRSAPCFARLQPSRRGTPGDPVQDREARRTRLPASQTGLGVTQADRNHRHGPDRAPDQGPNQKPGRGGQNARSASGWSRVVKNRVACRMTYQYAQAPCPRNAHAGEGHGPGGLYSPRRTGSCTTPVSPSAQVSREVQAAGGTVERVSAPQVLSPLSLSPGSPFCYAPRCRGSIPSRVQEWDRCGGGTIRFERGAGRVTPRVFCCVHSERWAAC